MGMLLKAKSKKEARAFARASLVWFVFINIIIGCHARCDKSIRLCSKQREIYAAIAAMLQKMRMVGEIVVFAMFEDKDALCG